MRRHRHEGRTWALTLGALGVVFGDIGTSPLYALRECFAGHNAVALSSANVYGAVSLIVWLLIAVVCVKYVVFVLQADNKGEGGIMALVALIERLRGGQGKMLSYVPFLAILGTALLFSDGMITPAISVLSAIEGLGVGHPEFSSYILPFSLVVLALLFLAQSLGTMRLGKFFGYILVLWFGALGVLGALSIVREPAILLAFNPLYALRFLFGDGAQSLHILATVFLAVTGAEVLYADMGHFGRRPMRLAWFGLVFPALILNYLGQGAYLLTPQAIPDNLFFRICPSWLLLPMVVLATLATTIASQAVITGAFSLARQAVQLGYWPRVRIRHMSAATIGQVYIPFMNFTLFVATMLCIAIFKNSSSLAGAYGITVSATMLITTWLTLLVLRARWQRFAWLVSLCGLGFLALDGALFAANATKLFSGGWVVVLLSVGICTLMTAWLKVRQGLREKFSKEAMPMENFLIEISRNPPLRVPGTAVYLSANAGAVPRVLRHNLAHYKVLHERIIVLAMKTEDIPHLDDEYRARTKACDMGIAQILISCGFMEHIDVPKILADIDPQFTQTPDVTYFLGRESLALWKDGTIPYWQKLIYTLMARNAHDAAVFYQLPSTAVLEIGTQVEL